MAKVLLVCSSGGHLDHLLALRSWWTNHERRWVTFDKPDTRSVLITEQTIWAHHPTTRSIPNLLRNVGVAWRTLRRWRPDVVVSSGAGVALPFFVLAKMFGIRTVYVEVYDRIASTTLTGRLCLPLSDLFLVQWPSQQELYPGSVLIGELM
jgi:beta-1,4-N-acetylglucosaminyltransferase